MGIPRLTSHVQPYLTPTILGCSDHDCPLHNPHSRPLVIDGPALVYAVYYRLLACKPERLNALDAQPSYREIGDAVVRFLEEVERCGVVT